MKFRFQKLNGLGHQTEGFSDDLATILWGKFVPTIYDILQGILDRVLKWCDENEVNPVK